MELATREKNFTELKYKILYKRNSLLDRYDEIKTASKENELLEGVLQDYVDYYKQALEEKKRQEESLILLHDYLMSINNAVKMSDYQMEELRNEKNQIIQRLGLVRQEMSKLLDKTKNHH